MSARLLADMEARRNWMGLASDQGEYDQDELKLVKGNFIYFFVALLRSGVRVAEGARLESVYARKGIAGSNPALSASQVAAIHLE